MTGCGIIVALTRFAFSSFLVLFSFVESVINKSKGAGRIADDLALVISLCVQRNSLLEKNGFEHINH